MDTTTITQDDIIEITAVEACGPTCCPDCGPDCDPDCC